MTTEKPDPCDTPPPCESCGDDEGCQPELINHLKCKPEGIAAQAKSNAENQPDVIAAQDTFDQTRRDYRDARQLHSHDIHDLQHEICSLVERIRCKFKQEHVADCIDKAHACIKKRLCKCAEPTEPPNCEFDTDTCDLDDAEFQQRKKQYDNDLARAKDRFLKLSAEPTDLATRVADAKTELAKINTEYAGDPATTDLKEVYAHALVAQDQIGKLWNGFDSYTEYADKLCSALVCWTKAAEAVAILAGQDAVRTCHANAKKKSCDDLAANTVKEILAYYERLCGHESDEGHGCDECGHHHDHDHECDECDCGRDHDRDECSCGHNHDHGGGQTDGGNRTQAP